MNRFILFVILVLCYENNWSNAQNCDASAKYRTYDGTCNNLDNPYFGSSPRSHSALVALDYGDGKICPRKAAPNTPPLPLAVDISYKVMLKDDKPFDPNGLSEMVIYFGMFVAHDFALSYPTDDPVVNYPCAQDTAQCPITRMFAGSSQQFQTVKTPCVEVAVNLGTICNGTTNQQCGCTVCTSGQYQQTNFMTSYLDLSNVYGITSERSSELRNGAKIRVTSDNLLPLAPSADGKYTAVPCIQPNNSTGPCLDAGDALANISPFLQILQTLFVREHNRLVDKFKSIFTDEETLFQETRRVTVAMMQHIIYSEYLPSILGKCMSKDLTVPSNYYQYDSTLDASTTKEFVTGAFRFGHSQPIDFGSLGKIPHVIPFGQLYTLKPYQTSGPNIIDLASEALFNDRAKETDNYYNDQMVNQFKFSNFPPMGNFPAIDVQRGRLHGIAPYLDIRKFLQLSVPKTYSELSSIIPQDVVEKLQELYGDTGLVNLDMFLAGLAEIKISNCKGTLFGYTFQKIIEDQFRKAKLGDRFWYEQLGEPWSFTKEQLKEIRKTSLSGLTCRNTNLMSAPANAFYVSTIKVPCLLLSSLTDINAKYWKTNGGNFWNKNGGNDGNSWNKQGGNGRTHGRNSG